MEAAQRKLNKRVKLYLREVKHANLKTLVNYALIPLLFTFALIYHLLFSSKGQGQAQIAGLSQLRHDDFNRVFGDTRLRNGEDTLRGRGQEGDEAQKQQKGVSIWYFPPCRGTFHSQPAKHSDVGFPYVIIRDATVDRRPVTMSVLRGCRDRNSARFTLYLSVHGSIELSKRHIKTVLHHRRLALSVHYVLHATQFLLRGPYRPGKRTFFGHRATEWHVGLCLSMVRDEDADEYSQFTYANEAERVIADAVDGDARFNISIGAKRYDGVRVPIELEMSLGCVQGWETPGIGLPAAQRQFQQHPLILTNRHLLTTDGLCTAEDNVSYGGVTGAVLFSGSALYGHKKRDAVYFREIAHFALRALEGPVRYDAVVMTVVLDTTVSDGAVRCAGQSEGDDEETCYERLRIENNGLLERVGREVERELRVLRAAPDTASKVVLIPSCTLGSDAWRSEFGDACNQTKHYGQYWATVFAYAPIAPFFKWAVSNDMDEFLMPEGRAPASVLDWQHADVVLDRANLHTEGNPAEGSFVAQWLNFLIDSQKDSRHLSRTLARGRVPQLTDRFDRSRSPHCYDVLGDDTGKSVVRCNVGFGFTVHSSIFVFRNAVGRVNFTLGWRVNRDLRTWHARYNYSKGTCMYKI